MARIFNFLDGISTKRAERLAEDGYAFRMEGGHVQAVEKEGMTTWWVSGYLQDGTQFMLTIDAVGEFDMLDRMHKIYPDGDVADYEDYGVLTDDEGYDANVLKCEFARRLEV